MQTRHINNQTSIKLKNPFGVKLHNIKNKKNTLNKVEPLVYRNAILYISTTNNSHKI